MTQSLALVGSGIEVREVVPLTTTPCHPQKITNLFVFGPRMTKKQTNTKI